MCAPGIAAIHSLCRCKPRVSPARSCCWLGCRRTTMSSHGQPACGLCAQEDPRIAHGQRIRSPEARLRYFSNTCAGKKTCEVSGAPLPVYRVDGLKVMMEFPKPKGDAADAAEATGDRKQVRCCPDNIRCCPIWCRGYCHGHVAIDGRKSWWSVPSPEALRLMPVRQQAAATRCRCCPQITTVYRPLCCCCCWHVLCCGSGRRDSRVTFRYSL